MDTPTRVQVSELYDGAPDDIVNPDEISVEDPTGQDENMMEMLQKELLEHQGPADVANLTFSDISLAETDEKELATRSPPTARVSASTYHPISRIDNVEPKAPAPAAPSTPVQSTFVYESATYSPSFPSSVIYPEEDDAVITNAPPASPPQHAASITPPASIQTLPELAPQELVQLSLSFDSNVSSTESAPAPLAATTTTEPEAEEPPKSDIERLSDRLREDPHDGQLWQVYINLVDQSGDMEVVEAAYERLVEAFPNTVCDLCLCYTSLC